MVLQLSDVVVCGEIINTRKNSVHGWLGLRDRDTPLPLQLTGNCAPDLAGRHFRFTARPARQSETTIDLSRLALQQIGPTGTITAARKVKVSDEWADEPLLSTANDDAAADGWKPSLYLEWFSQNGRVVVELVDPEIEFLDDDEEFDIVPVDADERPGPTSGYLELPLPIDFEPDSLLDEEDDFDSDDDDDGDDDLDEDDAWEAESDDPYGLFPEELHDHFDRAAAETNHSLMWGEDEDQVAREIERMDELIERGEDVPVGSLFDPPMRLPSPKQMNQMSDPQAEQVLKSLLARLALYGVALDICEHYTPRDAYRLLVERICPEEGVFPELRNTQWVQHFMTHEFCPQCDAEFEWEENRREEEN